jgi:hypothetical protein
MAPIQGWAKRSVPTRAAPVGHGAKSAPLPTLQAIPPLSAHRVSELAAGPRRRQSVFP